MWKYSFFLLCIVNLSSCDVTTTESEELINGTDSSLGSSEEVTIIIDEDTTTIKPPNEEAKLPVDLLSEDVLLDPNVVLARLSRRDLRGIESKWAYQPYQYNWNNPQVIKRKYSEIRRFEEPPKKFRVYPVFPGK